MNKLLIKLLLPILFFVSYSVQAQDKIASTGRIGPFKLNVSVEQIEEILGVKISRSAIKITADNYEKWYQITHDGVDYALGFKKYESEDNSNKSGFQLERIKCKDVSVTTKSGITIGNTKLEAFAILDQLGVDYRFSKYTEVDDDGRKTNVTSEHIFISDNGQVLTLEIKNGKIYGFTLSIEECGC
jgi:hypothetical protein